MNSTIFWDITPCRLLKINRRFGRTELCLSPALSLVSCSGYSSTLKMEAICSSETELCLPVVLTLVSCSGYSSTLKMEAVCSSETELCLTPAFTLVSCPGYFSTLEMEAICSSETSVDFQRTTRGYIPEDSTLYNHRCENLKSYIP
jgi:hypothetical protein